MIINIDTLKDVDSIEYKRTSSSPPLMSVGFFGRFQLNTFWREGAGLLSKLDSIQLTSLLNSPLSGMNSSDAAHNP